MADIANLVLGIDSTQVPKGTAALNELTAAGSRAEAATAGLGRGYKGAAAEGTAMAVAAQASARAAMDQAAGFGAATSAARVNTLAMRETLVVARELSRGNFTRIPGSLTLLAQGISSQGAGISGYATSLLQTLGIIKQVQNAELAEAATAATTAAAGVAAAARKAGANILAADTELALAEAQLRVAETSTAEAAAQTRIALANQAVAVASTEAAIAENALAVAQGRATGAASASAAATTTRLGALGKVLGPLAIAALATWGAFKALQASFDDSGKLDRYAQSLVKTKEQLKDLEDKVGGFQITWGDVFHGLAKAAGDALGADSIFERFKENNKTGFQLMLHNAVEFSAQTYGVLRGTYQTIVDDWSKLPAAFGDAFYSAVNAAIGALNKLVKFGADQLNGLIASVSKFTGFSLGTISAPQIGQVANPYAGTDKAVGADLHGNVSKYTAQGRASIQRGVDTIYDDIAAAAEERIKGGLPKDKKGRTRRAAKQPVDHADDTIAKLDEQILQAKISLTKDATEEASLKVQELRIARDKTIMDAQSLLNTHKITQSEFDTIKLRAQELDNLKERAVLNARDIALLKEDQARKDQLFDFQTEDLKFADDNATSQAAHRKVQLDMLDIAYKKKALDLQILEDTQRIAGATPAQLRLIQDQIDRLPTEKNYAQAAVKKQTQDPLQQWLDKVPHDAAAITEAIQGIEVNGLDNLASSIAGLVTGTESLGKAFKNIAHQIIGDIVQMTVKMLIFRAISGIFGGGTVDLTGAAGASIPRFANGGSMIIGGNGGVDNNVLSINGKPRAMVGNNETLAVYPNGGAANNNKSGPIEVVIGFGPAPEFAPYVQQVSAAHAAQAVQVSVNHTNQTLKSIVRPKLNGH